MLLNGDPENGGIIDQEIKSKEWFVIFNDDRESITGLATREEAIEAFKNTPKVSEQSDESEPEPEETPEENETDDDRADFSYQDVKMTGPDHGLYSVKTPTSNAGYRDPDEAYANYAAQVYERYGKVMEGVEYERLGEYLNNAIEMGDETSAGLIGGLIDAIQRQNKADEVISGEEPEENLSTDPEDNKETLEKAKEGDEKSQKTIEGIREKIASDDSLSPREKSNLDNYYDFGEHEWAKKRSDEGLAPSGEDLYVARHKRNQWRSLEEAEKNGTAAKFVKRDALMKAEQYDMADTIREDGSNITAALMGHLMMKKFPSKPNESKTYGRDAADPEKRREQYLEFYRGFRDAITEIAGRSDNHDQVFREGRKWMADTLNAYHRERRDEGTFDYDHYKFMHKAYKSMTGYGSSSPRGMIAKFGQYMKDEYPGSASVAQWTGEVSISKKELAKSHVLDMIGGKSLDAAFGRSKGGKKGPNKDKQVLKRAYDVETIRRKGPTPNLDVNDAKGNNNILRNEMGIKATIPGNSLTDKEYRHHLAKSAEAFRDMADVLGIPESAISINGKLGMMYGANGVANSLASYQPDQMAINLNRDGGAGSLAHEWAHFMDNMIGKAAGDGFASDVVHDSTDGGFAGLKKAWKESGFDDRMGKAVDDHYGPGSDKAGYWKSSIEKFARTFERHVQKKLLNSDRENSYLTGLRKAGDPFWPTDQELEAMSPHIDKIMEHFKGNTDRYEAIIDSDYRDRFAAYWATDRINDFARMLIDS